MLEHLTAAQNVSRHDWVSAWTVLLAKLFHSGDKYMVTQLSDLGQSQSTSFTGIEVEKDTPRMTPRWRVVLVVQIEAADSWPAGLNAVDDSLLRKINEAYQRDTPEPWMGKANESIFWIQAVGPHWRYGAHIEEDATTLVDFIEWQDTIHDDASYDHLCNLVTVIELL